MISFTSGQVSLFSIEVPSKQLYYFHKVIVELDWWLELL